MENINNYFITTRPYGYQNNEFKVDGYFETTGFTDDRINKYIDSYFNTNDSKLKEYLKYFSQQNLDSL